jgi:hypothetical protein
MQSSEQAIRKKAQGDIVAAATFGRPEISSASQGDLAIGTNGS